MFKKIKITESALNNIIRESVNKVINEDYGSDIVDRYYEIREQIGDKNIADAIVGFIGLDNLQKFINHLETNWEVRQDD